MKPEKEKLYRKAYVELCEIFKYLSPVQKRLIPETFIHNVEKNRDPNYVFRFDPQKGIFEQNLMTETEALLVEIYEKYLAPPEEKEMWDNYDEYCKMVSYEGLMEEEESDD